jgi:DNA-binding beta-propeller fold protein YncE
MTETDPQKDANAPLPAQSTAAGRMISSELFMKQRRWLILVLTSLLLVIFAVGIVFVQYLRKPKPLPELVAPINLNYPPHYLFSMYNVDQPVGVAVSPQGDRVYVAETGGERLIRIISSKGESLGSFAPPQTNAGERAPVYLATDSTGRVYVTDRLQHAIFVYDRDGKYLDTILSPNQTVSMLVAQQIGGIGGGMTIAYNFYRSRITYKVSGGEEKSIPTSQASELWAPLGVRIDASGMMLVTDVTKDNNRVFIMQLGDLLTKASWSNFTPLTLAFGASGQKIDQFTFPNTAAADSSGRIYVSDGNNGRISVWGRDTSHLFNFGNGINNDALNLPRGIVIDQLNRLFVTDAVGQNVHVFDVSGAEPVFLYSFGEFGAEDGLFNYPNDIAFDASGRLYIADRENNRIQVWSY